MNRLFITIICAGALGSVAAKAQAPAWLYYGADRLSTVPVSPANPLPVQPMGGGTGMLTNGSNAQLPVARQNLHIGNYATPYDYDPLCDGSSSTHDCSAAINTAAAVTSGSGSLVNVHLQAGIYYVSHQFSLSGGGCLEGDNRANTIIKVDQGFDPTVTTGVALLNAPSGDFSVAAPCIRHLTFWAEEPQDQGARSNYASLGVCTSGAGGTGCKYPAMIYQPNSTAGRVTLEYLAFLTTWNSIDLEKGSGLTIRDIQDGAINVGLTLNNVTDFGYVGNYEHWLFGANNGSAIDNLYADGNTVAASIGRTDGTEFDSFRTFVGRVQLTSAYTFGVFKNLALDGNNSTLEVAATSSTIGLQIHGGYATGAANNTTDTHCQIDIASGSNNVDIDGFAFSASGPGPGGLCVAGGTVNVTGGSMAGNGVTVANFTGGTSHVTGVNLRSPDRTFGAAQVISSGASTCVSFQDNYQTNAATNGEIALSLNDRPCHVVTNNFFNDWTFTPVSSTSAYWPNGPLAHAVTKTADYTATYADNLQTFDNFGASGTVVITLPGSGGHNLQICGVVRANTKTLTLTAAGGATITYNGTTTAGNGTLSASVVGSSVCLMGFGGNWTAVSVNGTWTPV